MSAVRRGQGSGSGSEEALFFPGGVGPVLALHLLGALLDLTASRHTHGSALRCLALLRTALASSGDSRLRVRVVQYCQAIMEGTPLADQGFTEALTAVAPSPPPGVGEPGQLPQAV